MKEAINAWHESALCSVWGAALHISCLSAANGPRVMMKRFTKQKGREGDTQRQGGEREARGGERWEREREREK